MASPQVENGYTRIANELLEQFSMPGMNGSELRIVLVITRKTYGFGKTSDRISLSQFSKATGMNRAQAVETLRSLIEKKVVIKVDGVFKLNKNYEEWVVCKRIPAEGSMQKHTPASMQKHTKSSMQKHTHKRKKETITKEISKTEVLQGQQWNELIDSFAELNPMYEDLYKNTTERKALESLAERFGYEKLLETVRALPSIVTLPYAPRITKPSELKRDFGKLVVFYKQEQSKLTNKINVFEV
jgi:phage replication O-like protein O